MITRRQFLKASAAAGVGLVIPWQLSISPASTPSIKMRASIQSFAPVDTSGIPKYAQQLVIPPAMPRTTKLKPQAQNAKNIDYYEIAVRQFQQQILPTGPATTVWGYGSINHPGSFNFPSFTIEAKNNRPVRVKWINDLIDSNGMYLPHLLPVDPTLHWANPAGGLAGRDGHTMFETTPGPYTGPVPMVTHVHGIHTTQEHDGYAEAWYLPNATGIPSDYATTGTYYDLFKQSSPLGTDWSAGNAVFEYPNDQPASTLWYHDHSLGMTRLNVYAGPAGFYLLRGGPSDLVNGVLPGPAPALGDAPGTRYYEIPIAIQDRSFNADNSLFYPDSRQFFDEYEGPYIPEKPVPPIWNPEFFGNTMVVNGRTWPKLVVEPRRYRFRMLNGCNARFLILKLTSDATARPAAAALPFWQIGAEGGFLPAPVQLPHLLMAPAERADVIVDFTGMAPGTRIYLINEGPDEPFGGGESGDDFDYADPNTTGQVMLFEVGPRLGRDPSTPPAQLGLPIRTPLPAASVTRKLSLNEEMLMPEDLPIAAMLGGVNSDGTPTIHTWNDPPTETPALNSTEIWELHNFTVDAHPIHLHQVQFEVVNRESLEYPGTTRPPETWETGQKDTVIAYPGEITRIKAHFDIPGRFVWHCHIVEHEDNEMMRPFQVG